MRSVFAAIVAVVFAAKALAGNIALPMPDNADTILYSEKSPLHFKSFGTDNTVNFVGVLELRGTYYYGRNTLDDGSVATVLYFLPDRATAARLPEFKVRGRPESIYLSNEAGFAREVIPAYERTGLKKDKFISGHADVLVDRFQAGIECDAPYFNAHFLRVAHSPVTLAMANLPDIGC
ncbi:MAG TPA: hypothetical protein VG309_04045 [Rhizomicrobium sp.]|jgi:hypothetical protein|nr:hypothetical protein [Rhizomicrobium sp.]